MGYDQVIIDIARQMLKDANIAEADNILDTVYNAIQRGVSIGMADFDKKIQRHELTCAALQGFCGSPNFDEEGYEDRALFAVKQADAVLEYLDKVPA